MYHLRCGDETGFELEYPSEWAVRLSLSLLLSKLYVDRAFSLSNHCTICSCGQGFTDPSAYTRHRETFGHAKGVTHGKPRDAIIKGVKVQHVAGLQLNVDLISDPSFIPPHFDVSYHFKGVPKPKGQEKYNPVDYIELAETTPTVPSVQMASSAGGAPIEYDVSGPPAPVQTEIRVEELGINTNYSYDVELPQETHPDQVPNGNVYAECHDPQTPYPEHKFTQPIANWHHTGANWYPYGYQENHAVAIDHHFTHPSQQTTGPHVQPGYQDMHSLSQVSHHAPWSMPSPQYNFFEEMGVPKHVFYPPLY